MTLIDLANPTRFLSLTARVLPWLMAVTAILLAAGLYLSALAPDGENLSADDIETLVQTITDQIMASAS